MFIKICFVFVISDNEDPVFTSPVLPDISRDTDNNLPTASVSWAEPMATDNSGTVTVQSVFSSPHSFPIGSTTVTYTATDPSNNMVTREFKVIVTGQFKYTEISFPKKLKIRYSNILKSLYIGYTTRTNSTVV